MSLTPKDKAVVRAFWDRVSSKAEDIGTEALSRYSSLKCTYFFIYLICLLICLLTYLLAFFLRMLYVYPQTKTYFSHWQDLSPTSVHVRRHGRVIMAGVADGVAKMDNLIKGLLTLSEQHVYTLRVDPANFKVGVSLIADETEQPMSHRVMYYI